MAYGKRYQTVIAGRVREDEMSFFKENKVAAPSGIWSLKRADLRVQPVVDSNFLDVDNVGKNTLRTVPLKSAYNAGSNNPAH